MGQELLQFGRACMVHIRDELAKDRGVPVTGMTFSLDPIYGQLGKRTGISIHTEPSAGHQDIIGYRMKIGFDAAQDRMEAGRGLEEVHATIKRLFGLQNNAAWMLRDRDSNDVWYTFSTREREPLQFFNDVLAKTDMKTMFTQAPAQNI